jgi:hypothetical protein
MAGRVRRTSMPMVTPRTKAKAAYPIGAMPRAPNTRGAIRASSGAADLSRGSDHQVTTRPHSPAAATATTPMSPSLTASQWPRVMLWFHTSRCVPASSSRPISGAPQKSPTRAGRSSTTRLTAMNGVWWSSKKRS